MFLVVQSSMHKPVYIYGGAKSIIFEIVKKYIYDGAGFFGAFGAL